MPEYIHGYSSAEQQRLLAQAAFWRESLILPALEFPSSGRVLEMGCGAGAVLQILSDAYPHLSFSGIDIESRQIEFARKLLEGRSVELRQGDATALPWPDEAFDAVYMIWFLEHLPEPVAALREALRVLKPGGRLWTHETNYLTLKFEPTEPSIEKMLRQYRDCFGAAAWIDAGARMESWIAEAGFERCLKKSMGFEWKAEAGLPEAVDYVLDFVESSLGSLAETEAAPGLRAMREASRGKQGLLSIEVHRCIGIKAS